MDICDKFDIDILVLVGIYEAGIWQTFLREGIACYDKRRFYEIVLDTGRKDYISELEIIANCAEF